MINKLLILCLLCLSTFRLCSQEGTILNSSKKFYYSGQFAMGYGYYLNGGDLISPGFEFRVGKFLTKKITWGGGVSYNQFKPVEGLYGVSILSELKYFIREEQKNWRYYGVLDAGLGIGGSRLYAGWANHQFGPRFYFGTGVSKRWKDKTKILLEFGYLFQNLQYIDNTPSRGWQIFQTESIMKYNFRRLQLKTGLMF